MSIGSVYSSPVAPSRELQTTHLPRAQGVFPRPVEAIQASGAAGSPEASGIPGVNLGRLRARWGPLAYRRGYARSALGTCPDALMCASEGYMTE